MKRRKDLETDEISCNWLEITQVKRIFFNREFAWSSRFYDWI